MKLISAIFTFRFKDLRAALVPVKLNEITVMKGIKLAPGMLSDI
jgi:hypothetical protein